MVAAPFIRQVNPRMERSNWVMLVCLSVDVDTPFSPKLKHLTFNRFSDALASLALMIICH